MAANLLRKFTPSRIRKPDDLLNRLEEDFRFPEKPTQITYSTAWGRVTVRTVLSNLEQRTYQSMTMYSSLEDKRKLYPGKPDSEISAFPIIICDPKQEIVGKSTMSVQFHGTFKGQEAAERLNNFIKSYNKKHQKGFSFSTNSYIRST